MTSGADVRGKGPRMLLVMGTFLQIDSTAIAGGVRMESVRRRESALRGTPKQSRVRSHLLRSSARDRFTAGGEFHSSMGSQAGTPKTRGGCHLADRTFGA